MSNKRNANDYDRSSHASKRGRADHGGGFVLGTTTTTTTTTATTTTIDDPAAPTTTSTSSDAADVAVVANNNASANARRGRAVRRRRHADSMLLLNRRTYEWARSLLSSSSAAAISDDSFYESAVENYLRRSAEIRRRYDRDYGDVVVFGSGDCGQLGCGVSVTESRAPRILKYLRGMGVDMIACGGLHSLALTGDGVVYSWGCNDEGSLGWKTGDDDDEDEDGGGGENNNSGSNGGYWPNKVVGFVRSAHGPTDDDDDGRGRGGGGGGGGGREEAVVITQVAAGETQSLALSSSGDVYAWGTYKDSEGRNFRCLPPPDDTRPSTGHKDMSNLEEDEDPMWHVPPRGRQDWPCHLTDMPGKAKDLSAGASFNAALMDDDTIVTWGVGTCGELARPVPVLDKATPNDVVVRDFLTPRPPVWEAGTTMSAKRSVTAVSCGGYHLLVVARDATSAGGDRVVYTSGLNQYGQLGHGDADRREVLTRVRSLDGRNIAKVEGGMHFSCFVDGAGRGLYACGRGDYGQLGITLELPDEGYYESLPVRVPLVHDIPSSSSSSSSNRRVNCIDAGSIVEEDQPIIEQVSCGSTHVLVLTRGGDAYSWGFGECGACGQGKSEEDVLRPRMIEMRHVAKVAGGGGASSASGGGAACEIRYVSGGGQHSAAIVKTGSTGFAS
ncbi:hypothetical protein ACHAW5_010340 [Stephanodiscus triporus]|uniref:RCC1-like domain-containing protein n=1 Tax=Stephanodiscus triporus TaxID=2934178 RepID=A0ABD3NPD5_9STRA